MLERLRNHANMMVTQSVMFSDQAYFLMPAKVQPHEPSTIQEDLRRDFFRGPLFNDRPIEHRRACLVPNQLVVMKQIHMVEPKVTTGRRDKAPFKVTCDTPDDVVTYRDPLVDGLLHRSQVTVQIRSAVHTAGLIDAAAFDHDNFFARK